MRTLLTSLAGAALLLAAPSASFAASAADFQLYVLHDLSLNGETMERAVAVGGNATFNSSTLKGGGAGAPSLVAGGALSYGNSGGSIVNGAVIGGANHAPSYMTVAAGQSVLPVDFASENQRLLTLSSDLGNVAANGTAMVQWGGLFLTGQDSALNVFNITTTQLGSITWFNTNIASGSQVLINVTGATANLTGGLNFYTPSNILWNFTNATTINAGGLSMSGTVLAPNALFNGSGGSINGDLIVGAFNGKVSLVGSGYGGSLIDPPLHSPPPPGALPMGGAVPEPAVWTMMILGFGAVGAMLRRRRLAAHGTLSFRSTDVRSR